MASAGGVRRLPVRLEWLRALPSYAWQAARCREEYGMSRTLTATLSVAMLVFLGCGSPEDEARSACFELLGGLDIDFSTDQLVDISIVRPVAKERKDRFLGKPEDRNRVVCRGATSSGDTTDTPWVDWANYWGAGDASSKARPHLLPDEVLLDTVGVNGALIDLEYERMELIRFNLFDNYTWETYINGSGGADGAAVKVWPEMRLAEDHPNYEAVGGDGPQLCTGDLIRGRTIDGSCNDMRNPLMGSAGTLFARNTQFETTFPDEGWNEIVANRHDGRIDLMTPDPQLVSRKLFTRDQSDPAACGDGYGPADGSGGNCDYQEAPFFNVLAAFWIQFMTHDWFSHMDEGVNTAEYEKVGCTSDEARELGCRPDDEMEKPLVAQSDPPGTFQGADGTEYVKRAPRTFANTNTAWWDGSQIYGYSEVSRQRVKRDPADRARLEMVRRGDHSGDGEAQGYLPLLEDGDPMHPAWRGQEATGFPDNFTIGMSFYHNVFAREHNAFVDAFRAAGAANPNADSGLRDPSDPTAPIAYADVTDDELFEVGRLVVSAMIAKIHTIEWTTQLLYNEPLYKGMNSNWGGLLEDGKHEFLGKLLNRIAKATRDSHKEEWANQLYSVFASGPGIFGIGSDLPYVTDEGTLNVEGVNGGINHFGSPFNFPEEFTTVYRLHPLVPDMMEFRDWNEPNAVQANLPVVDSFRAGATQAMTEGGLANWALSMGRQRLGLLTLKNHGRFLQNLKMERLESPTKMIDIAALDVLRDRQRGIPRFNEFRRQYGLRQLTSFDDFVDQRLPAGSGARQHQEAMVELLREVYGQHMCDSSKIISTAQGDVDDCFGGAARMVDNVEDVDTVVGWLAEFTRPHGYAISETQFVVFILNASRRLFSDRFFTSSFRPEFYSSLGYDWVVNNGPADGRTVMSNGHEDPISPMRRVLERALPELQGEFDHVVNVFDPWARDRGEYYSLEWTARAGAESDPAFADN